MGRINLNLEDFVCFLVWCLDRVVEASKAGLKFVKELRVTILV